ncbi:hypothetical protein CHARACLAT_023312 [Characodon lateralis]|uniref:Ig-like domain-containing protein n=1 Tax=Characodon lateralis TaxID=208331 RepID=A0ABU7CQQ6_9TELE|nr:hypothetical protein [Characodon lateralis]
MASVSAVSLLLVCCFAVVSKGCDQFAAVGQSFNVPLGYELKPTDALKWKFEDEIIFHKKQAKVLVKKSDINANGSLKLTNLKKDQAGVYIPEVFDKDGKSQTMKRTNLCVLYPVKKPTINVICRDPDVIFTCSHDQQPDGARYKWFQNEMLMINKTKISLKRKKTETKNLLFSCTVENEISSEKGDPLTNICFDLVKKPEINVTCKDSEVIFTCFAAQPDDAQYKWLLNGNEISNETKISLIRTTAESKNLNFSCEVYNEASSENSDFLTHACKGPTFLDLPEKLFGISIWVFIVSGAGFLLLLIIIVVGCCLRCKKKRRDDDDEELQYRPACASSSYCSA